MKIKFTTEYECDIDLSEHDMTETEFQLLSSYAKQNLILEWKPKWVKEDIYGVEVVDDF